MKHYRLLKGPIMLALAWFIHNRRCDNKCSSGIKLYTLECSSTIIFMSAIWHPFWCVWSLNGNSFKNLVPVSTHQHEQWVLICIKLYCQWALISIKLYCRWAFISINIWCKLVLISIIFCMIMTPKFSRSQIFFKKSCFLRVLT